MSDIFDPSKLSALVVDDNHYERGITVDMLRAIGVGRVHQAAHGADAWDLLQQSAPDCVFTDWLAPPMEATDLLRRVRLSEDSVNRGVPIFLLTHRSARADVEGARRAGADAYLRKPLSALIIQQRLKAVMTNPQPFIVTATYVGPCRRRHDSEFYFGPRRRLNDQIEEAVAADDDDVKAGLARARIAHLETQALNFVQHDVNSARRVFQAARELKDVATQISDGPLTLAAVELVRYLETMGAAALDIEALRTHIAALHQLAHLPNAMGAERQRVAQSLTRMVDKKIRQATAA